MSGLIVFRYSASGGFDVHMRFADRYPIILGRIRSNNLTDSSGMGVMLHGL